MSGPGIEAGTTCLQPASLIDVYPSLVDLAGFEVPTWLDGKSVKPQLDDPDQARGPAITSYGSGNTSVRTDAGGTFGMRMVRKNCMTIRLIQMNGQIWLIEKNLQKSKPALPRRFLRDSTLG